MKILSPQAGAVKSTGKFVPPPAPPVVPDTAPASVLNKVLAAYPGYLQTNKQAEALSAGTPLKVKG